MKKSSEHLQHLERKHLLLERQLDSLVNRPHLTPIEHQHMSELKKRKLLAKDGITALRQALASP
ncbi:MAG: hypothetical protein RL685_1670 [Pseudomonadota bacterium]|jgi:hypothetical protein